MPEFSPVFLDLKKRLDSVFLFRYFRTKRIIIMNNKIIAVDLDEVLSETIDQVLEVNNYQVNGMKITKEDVSSYYFHEIERLNLWIEDDVEIFDKLWNSDKKREVKPLGWALEKLNELKSEWYKFIIITARRDILREYTEKRIETYYQWIFDEIVFTNHYSENAVPKSEICKQKWIEIMIEDNLDYAMDMASVGVKMYLIDKPWNKQYNPEIHKWISKVNGWNEISF